MQEIAPGVAALPLSIENVYFIGTPGGLWALIDTGTPGQAGHIRAVARKRFGDTPPSAILLTHGHTDHSGSARALAEAWNVPIYVHPLEKAYVTGKSDYPPKDPTVGGAMAMVSRVFPMNIVDLTGLLKSLPPEGAVPGFPDWEWRFTPGHSPGHVSYFRASDRTLIAGDAFATVNLDSLPALVTKAPRISLPPTPFTCDWGLARKSVATLAASNPSAIGCGHGKPLTGPTVAPDLHTFSDTFTPPAHGRYVPTPARTDETGVIWIPPPAPDLFPLRAALAALVLGVLLLWNKRRKA